MNKYELIASLVDSLAWPLAITTIIFLLKSPIHRLILNLSKFKFNEIEIDFSAALEKVSEHMPIEFNERNESNSDVIELAKINPSSAIILSFQRVEHEIFEVIKRLAISPDFPPHNAALKNIQLMSQYTNIDRDTLKALDELRKLRNLAVHTHPEKTNITYSDASKYHELSESVIAVLKELKYQIST